MELYLSTKDAYSNFLLRVFFAAFPENAPTKDYLHLAYRSPDPIPPEKVSNEDKEAFNRLFNTHYKPMVVYAKSLTHDLEAAREIVQDAFSKYWENRHTIRDQAAIPFFLSRTVKNIFINGKRQIKRLRGQEERVSHHLLALGSSDTENTLEAETTAAYTLVLLSNAIQALSPKYRIIITLHFQENLTLDEVADKLRLPYKTVYTRKVRALERMRFFFDNVADRPDW